MPNPEKPCPVVKISGLPPEVPALNLPPPMLAAMLQSMLTQLIEGARATYPRLDVEFLPTFEDVLSALMGAKEARSATILIDGSPILRAELDHDGVTIIPGDDD